MSASQINSKDVTQKILSGQSITLSFRYINENILMVLNSIVARVLSHYDQVFLLNSTITILREIVINALKANAKRVFFLKHDLDISDPNQYKKGMDKFKKEVVGDFDQIEADLTRSDFYVRITFEIKNKVLVVTVNNNAPILPAELERIKFRIDKAIQYNDFTEAYEEIEDDTEGAGLGIVLTILLLKNMGVGADNYHISNTDRLTTTTLSIPHQLRPGEIITDIKNHIISEIDGIPTFPQNIIQLQQLCNDPNSSIDTITQKIAIDPALTADVIKLSNSAGIAAGKHIEDIKTAVVTIGLKNLNAILTASNARRILNERYTSFEQIWDHCNKVAFYARHIALHHRMNKIVEMAFMAGLLHDLGKIVLLATDHKLVNRIADIVQNRKITTTTIMEEISIGISHSTIGSLIAQKWNFPEYLVNAINNHHSPLNATAAFRDVVYTISLANIITGVEDRKYSYYYIEESVLDLFKLTDIGKLTEFHQQLKARYEAHKSLF